jgi:hypothetical protein
VIYQQAMALLDWPNGAEALKVIRRPDWKSVNQHRAQWIDRWNREIIG